MFEIQAHDIREDSTCVRIESVINAHTNYVQTFQLIQVYNIWLLYYKAKTN